MRGGPSSRRDTSPPEELIIASPRRYLRALALLAAAFGILTAASAGYAALSAPVASSPCAGATVDRLGAFAWSGVSGAYQYEFQIASASNFLSPADDYTTRNT